MIFRFRNKFNSLSKFQKFFTTSFTLILSVLTILTLIQINTSELNDFATKVIFSLFVIVIFSLFAYLSLYDIVYFEIPGKLAIFLPVSILIMKYSEPYNRWQLADRN